MWRNDLESEQVRRQCDESATVKVGSDGDQGSAACQETSAGCDNRYQIVWSSVLVLTLLHIAGFYGAFLRSESKWQSQIFGRLIAVLSSYSVTAGAHRLWCHRAYKANLKYQVVMMVLMSFIYQNSIYIWVRDHRMHHMYSETDADPHNAKRGFFFSHIGWLMMKKHPDVRRKGKNVDMSDLEVNPVVMLQHRHYHKFVFVHCILIMLVVPWYFFGESAKVCFFYLTCYRLVVTLNITWGINSVAHLYGGRPYDKRIGPAENSLLSYLSFGEGFHNYHHTFPWDYRAAELGTDGRNTTTYLIDFFAWLGWVWDRRTVRPEHIANQRKLHGDGSQMHVEYGWRKKLLDAGRVLLMTILYGYIL